RLLLEPVDRHDRERLADRPVVEHRLEHREVAEVLIDEHALELDDLGRARELLVLLRGLEYPVADTPVERLRERPLLERKIAEREQRADVVEPLLGVVIRLEQLARLLDRRQIIEDASERLHRL